MNLVIKPKASSASSRTASPTRRLSDLTVRLLFPWSLTRKNSPYPKQIVIASITAIIKKLSIMIMALIEGVNRIRGQH